jgi:hypothetical protein
MVITGDFRKHPSPVEQEVGRLRGALTSLSFCPLPRINLSFSRIGEGDTGDRAPNSYEGKPVACRVGAVLAEIETKPTITASLS